MAILDSTYPVLFHQILLKFLLFTFLMVGNLTALFSQDGEKDSNYSINKHSASELQQILSNCENDSIPKEKILEYTEKGIRIAQSQKDTLIEAM